MDFEYTEEQRLLRESLDRLLADSYGFDKRKAYLAEPEGFSRTMWAQYAELGLLGLPFAEEHGGFGGGGVEVMMVMEAFGRVLALEPYLATVVLAGTALRLAGSDAQQAAIVPQIAEGSLRLAVAHGERQARYDLYDVMTTAKPKSRRLAARRRQERRRARRQRRQAHRQRPHRRRAQRRPTASRCSWSTRGRRALRAAPTRCATATGAAEIALSGVEIGADAVLGSVGGGLPVIERVVEAGIAATCAEAVGAMETMLAMTIEYMKTRAAIRQADRREPGVAAPRHRDDDVAGAGPQHGDAGGDDD